MYAVHSVDRLSENVNYQTSFVIVDQAFEQETKGHTGTVGLRNHPTNSNNS